MKKTSAAGVALLLLLVASLSSRAAGTGWTLTAWNDLGMHCMDSDFADFSLLPPYNVIHAQLVDPSGNLVVDAAGITVTYEAVADPAGSINTTSAGKTNFWDHVLALFGVSLPPDAGLSGYGMPGPANVPQAMAFDAVTHQWWSAEGIPLTPNDDAGKKNYYPMMRMTARDATNAILATTDIVLPVSDEMSCSACHRSGGDPATMPAVGWAWDAVPDRDYRKNVLLLHDDKQKGDPVFTAALATAGYSPLGLYATATSQGTSILCARCHASNALPGTGIAGIEALTGAMHRRHSFLDVTTSRDACYKCHPGSSTRCLRGAMGNAVSGTGEMAMQCQGCHGSMAEVGDLARVGWLQQPSCQSCHTGTAMNNAGQIRYTSAFSSPGVYRTAPDATYATNPDVPLPGFSLYRFSRGHGGLSCEACHGSTHAEAPSSEANDNVQNQGIQGHEGMLVECASCHGTQTLAYSGGPHGMHPVGQTWVGSHPGVVESSGSAQCRPCHGSDYRGTVLSRTQAVRTLSAFGTKTFWRGFQVGCYACHRGPSSDEQNPNRAPVATSRSATTPFSASVAIPLQASDPEGSSLTLRIVSQSVHGTTGLTGTTATYFPSFGFVGQDTFTFAASDGSTQSNLATVTIDVTTGCTLACSAVVPETAIEGSFVTLDGSAAPSGCTGSPSYDWIFGDGTAHGSSQGVSHAYAAASSYRWTMTATLGAASCVREGVIRIGAASPLSVPFFVQGTRVETSNHGQDVRLTWDAGNCPSTGYHVLYGYGSGLRTWTVAGSACGIGASGVYDWAAVPNPSADPSRLLWFLVVGDDMVTKEGSWGTTSAGVERNGGTASGRCGMTSRINETCGAP